MLGHMTRKQCSCTTSFTYGFWQLRQSFLLKSVSKNVNFIAYDRAWLSTLHFAGRLSWPERNTTLATLLWGVRRSTFYGEGIATGDEVAVMEMRHFISLLLQSGTLFAKTTIKRALGHGDVFLKRPNLFCPDPLLKS